MANKIGSANYVFLETEERAVFDIPKEKHLIQNILKVLRESNCTPKSTDAFDRDVKREFSVFSRRAQFFDGSTWKTFLNLSEGQVNENASDLEKLKKGLLLPSEAKNTVGILTQPEGLSIDKLLAILPNLIKVEIDADLSSIAKTEVGQTHNIVMTNSTLENSRSPEGRKDLLSTLNCNMPKVLEALSYFALCILTNSNPRAGKDYCAITYCEEQVDGHHFVVGTQNQEIFITTDKSSRCEEGRGFWGVIR